MKRKPVALFILLCLAQIASFCLAEEVIAVKGIKLSVQNLTVSVGEFSEPIEYTVLPENATNRTVFWSSADETIATVDENGIIKGIKAGKTNISAMPQDQSKANKAVKISVTVIQPVESIELDNKEFRVAVGDNVKPVYTILPDTATNKKVSWSSSDQTIAQVTGNGTVTGKSPGSATITCEAQDGSGAHAEISVYVFQPVKTLKIDPKSVTTFVGATTEALTVTITPEYAEYQSVTWSSSDESVATVDENGQITALAIGTTVITATSTEPSDGTKKPITASCKLQVDQAVEYIWLSQNEKKSTNKKLVLDTTIKPDTATNKKLKWESSNTKVATVRNGVVTIKKHEGETIIKALSTDGSEIYGSCRVTVGFSGIIISIGSRVKRTGSYTWSADAFTGNGKLDKDNIDSEAIKNKTLTEGEWLLVTTRDEILFRDIPWGSSLSTTSSFIKFDSFWRPDVLDKGSYKELQKAYFDNTVNAAGHRVSGLTCRFAYSVNEEGKLDKHEKLYYAEYIFEDDDQSSVSKDIEEKLVKLYGEADTFMEGSGTGKKLIWYGVNNTKLTYNTSEGITLTYEWLDGKNLQLEADKLYMEQQAEKDKEEKTYSDSTSGL